MRTVYVRRRRFYHPFSNAAFLQDDMQFSILRATSQYWGGSLIIGQGIQVPVFLYTILYIGDKLVPLYIAHLVENCANIRVYVENANFLGEKAFWRNSRMSLFDCYPDTSGAIHSHLLRCLFYDAVPSVQLTRVGGAGMVPSGLEVSNRQFSAITHSVDNQFGKPASDFALTCADVDVAVVDVLVSGLAVSLLTLLRYDEYAGIRHFPRGNSQQVPVPKSRTSFFDAHIWQGMSSISVVVAAIDFLLPTQVHVGVRYPDPRLVAGSGPGVSW